MLVSGRVISWRKKDLEKKWCRLRGGWFFFKVCVLCWAYIFGKIRCVGFLEVNGFSRDVFDIHTCGCFE